MKLSIVVSVLVVLLCHEVSCHYGPALLRGDCTPENVPADLLAECAEIVCEELPNGQVSRVIRGCSPVRCIDTKALESRPLDLTKTYPDCCPADLKCAEEPRAGLSGR